MTDTGGVLAMLELDGDTDRLLAAAAEVDRLMPSPAGMLIRLVAPTETGIVLFRAEARQRHADDPGHVRALEESGIRDLSSGIRSRAFPGAVLQRVAER